MIIENMRTELRDLYEATIAKMKAALETEENAEQKNEYNIYSLKGGIEATQYELNLLDTLPDENIVQLYDMDIALEEA